MIDIEDKTYIPSLNDLEEFMEFPLFCEMFHYLQDKYSCKYEIIFSGDRLLLGWNLRFFKSGKTLLRIYPKKKYFKVLLVVGKNEKERTESILPQLSERMQEIYVNTSEGMGQRWMVFDIKEHSDLYDDMLKIIEFRRK